MKKTTLYSMLLTGVALFGCSTAQQPQTGGQQVKITEQQAKDIALKEAGGGQVTEFSYDGDDGIPNYDISILNGTTEYEFEINAVDGSILKRDMETHSNGANVTTNIDEAKVKEIVNNQVKGTILGMKLDQDDMRLVYDVTVIDDTYKYEFEISAQDGSILSQDKELIDQSFNTQNIQGVNIDVVKAKEIALTEVPNGVVTEVSFDYEHGMLVYEITVVEGAAEYEFEISGVDGSIISKSID